MAARGGPIGPLVALVLTVAPIACGAPAAPTPSLDLGTIASPSADTTPGSPRPSEPPATAPSDQTPTPSPQAGWIRLADAPEAGGVWAPDAAHLLVWTGVPGGPPESQQMRLVTRHGETIEQYEAIADPVWIDASRFLAYRLDWRQHDDGAWYAATGANGERLGATMIGQIGSPHLTEIEMPLGPAISNGHGTLAIVEFDGSGSASHAIWADSTVSAWRAGYPAAWSPDGERLLLIHSEDAGPGAEGWLEVTDGAGGSTVWASDATLSVGFAAFDPTGSFLAYPDFVPRPREPRQVPEFDLVVRVVDLATGDVGGFQARENGDLAWTAAAQIVVVGFGSQQATIYDRDGRVLAAEAVAGPNVTASADGTTLLFHDAELDQPELQILRGDSLRLLGSPGTLAGPAPLLAPDGSGVLVAVRLPSGAPHGPPATLLMHAL